MPIILQEEISKLSKKYASQLNPLRQEATRLKVEEEQIPSKRQDMQNQLHDLEMKEKELMAKEIQKREHVFNEAVLKVEAEKIDRQKREAKNKKDLKDIDAGFNKSSKNLHCCPLKIVDG